MLRRTAFRIVRPRRNPTRSRRTGNGCRKPGGTQRIRHKKRGAPQYAPTRYFFSGRAMVSRIDVSAMIFFIL